MIKFWGLFDHFYNQIPGIGEGISRRIMEFIGASSKVAMSSDLFHLFDSLTVRDPSP